MVSDVESGELYPSDKEQQQLRLQIARNLAFLEVTEIDDDLVRPQIENAKITLNRLGSLARLSHEDVSLMNKTLRMLESLGVPVAGHP